MSTRANWFVEAAASLDGTDDPFAAPIEEIGERIDLRDPQAALSLRLGELLEREGRLFNSGVSCPIKDRPDTSCHACPVSRAHDREGALGVLCRLGREQERVVTEMAVHTCREQ